MKQSNELVALLSLIDDPDEDVYTVVSSKIIDYGKSIIPNLENLWENSISQEVQSRIEHLIHRLHFSDLVQEFMDWDNTDDQNLIVGAILAAKFQYPDVTPTYVFQQIEKLRKNIWLELNNYLTPLEQANVITSIIYKYYQLKGGEVKYAKLSEFTIHKVLENKAGNAITNAIIYQSVCELLNVNARLINIPNQMLIAFYHSDYDNDLTMLKPQDQIMFYVDAINGNAFSQNEVDNYLKREGLPDSAAYYKPMTHGNIIHILLKEMAKCYFAPHHQYKRDQLNELADLVS